MPAMQNSEGADSMIPAADGDLREARIVFLLCLLAAIHVFLFSAAFPFFNNVDEAMHFDLVLKYAHGDVPRKFETVSSDSTTYLALMHSYVYLQKADEFPGGRLPPPLWTLPPKIEPQVLAVRRTFWQAQDNYEVFQAPLYYVLAGLWWHLGQGFGFHDGRLVYWLRFLNVALIIGLVWLGYATARLVFPENRFVRLGVPALLAFMPQSAFYSVGNDMLSALCFGITFIFLLRWLRAEKPAVGLGAATGAAFAAVYLAKTANLPLLAVIAAVIVFKAWRDIRQGTFREALPALAAFLYCSEPPIIGWILWCKRHFGDATGSVMNTHFMGWTLKPFTQWWHHPIFSVHGFWTYLSGQFGTFWQGEFWWHGLRLSLPGTDSIYALVSLMLVAAALPALSPQSSGATSLQRGALWLGLVCFGAELGFFALMSIVYDFHDSVNPSRQHPYFQAGRLLLGALIPFLLLIVCGLYRAFNRFGPGAKWVALGLMILTMAAVEIATNWPAFSNGYNWFHLP